LGALSIVRFRTPVKEPEEIGFIMLLIAASIGIATFNFRFIFLLYVAVTIALSLKKWLPRTKGTWARTEGILLLNLDNAVYERQGEMLVDCLRTHFTNLRLDSVSSVEDSTSLQYVFSRFNADSWSRIQSEIKEKVPVRKLNIFFHRPGAAA